MSTVLQAALVTFREGLESFLIVGVIVAYLRRTGRSRLIRGVHIGLGLSAATCSVGALLWMQVPNQPLYEGIFAIAAALLVGLLLIQMLRAGRHLKEDIEAQVGRVAARGHDAGDANRASWRAILGVALATTLLVTREGLEALFFLGVQAFAARALPLAAGATLGIIAAAALAWAWTRVHHRLQMSVVLRVTAIFLALFLVQLLVYGVHEIAESGFIEGSQAFHDATERFGPDGDIGQGLAYSLLAAPILYLILARRRPSQRQSPGAATGHASGSSA
jgi:high-affinity iron transporter